MSDVRVRLERVGLTVAMVLVTVNIWTGGPLLALWIGSRLQPPSGPSMLAVSVAAISLGVISYLLVRLLARIDAVYGRLTGRPSTVGRHVPWLRSMRGERPHEIKHARDLSPLEIILVSMVVAGGRASSRSGSSSTRARRSTSAPGASTRRR